MLFAYMIAVSWLCSLKFCRIFEGMRAFIDILQGIIGNRIIGQFMFVLLVFDAGIVMGQYFVPNSHTYTSLTLIEQIRSQFGVVFGYWSDSE